MVTKTATNRGFALVEGMLIISVLFMLAAVFMPEIVKTRDKAREEETKANLHMIQIAVERYASDHSGAYPNYILGGDKLGWDEKMKFGAPVKPEDQDRRPPLDPLIEYGYFNRYPANPFIKSGDGPATINAITGFPGPGKGDVRFGYNGECMGNCLDDPRFLFSEYGVPTRLQYTMGRSGMFLGVIDNGSPNTFFTMGGIPQWSSSNPGASDLSVPQLNYWWPGEFFYRCGGDFFVANALDVSAPEYENIWGWPYMRVNKYMLGAYGSLRTEGLDVIRLTTKEGEAASVAPGAIDGMIEGQYYQDHNDTSREASHPGFTARVGYSNPEVFGGGDKGLMPQFPYYSFGTRKWIYGAPDGYPDGIVLVLTKDFDYGSRGL
jgi:type II secretory pathway pseudopilin PulG